AVRSADTPLAGDAAQVAARRRIVEQIFLQAGVVIIAARALHEISAQNRIDERVTTLKGMAAEGLGDVLLNLQVVGDLAERSIRVRPKLQVEIVKGQIRKQREPGEGEGSGPAVGVRKATERNTQLVFQRRREVVEFGDGTGVGNRRRVVEKYR